MRKIIVFLVLLMAGNVYAKDKDTIVSFDEIHMNRVYDAFAVAYSYQATINGQPNPETKEQHYQRRLKSYVAEILASYEGVLAGEIARKAAYEKANSEVSIK